MFIKSVEAFQIQHLYDEGNANQTLIPTDATRKHEQEKRSHKTYNDNLECWFTHKLPIIKI